MNFKLKNQLLLLFVLISINCNSDKTAEFDITNIGQKHINDKSLEVFDIQFEEVKSSPTLTGATSNKKAYSDLKAFSDSSGYQFNVKLLPDASLGDSIYALVNVSVTPLREMPMHSSQMVDQVIMGNTIRLLRKSGDWYQIQTHYLYIGWIHKTAIYRCDRSTLMIWRNQAIFKINQLYSTVYSLPKINSDPLSDLVLNNKLKVIRKLLKWVKVELPDNRTGYVRSKELEKVSPYTAKNFDSDKLLSVAHQMMGIPYLWGGNSTKANDCSGFTQTVFKSQNFQLPRDARQQALLGKSIELKDSQPGDLFYFGDGEKVKHVGICVGGKAFIHQGGKVDIHSLDPYSKLYNAKRANTFLFAKRLGS